MPLRKSTGCTASKIRCEGLSASIAPTSTSKRPACLHIPDRAVVLQCALASRQAVRVTNNALKVAPQTSPSMAVPGKQLPSHRRLSSARPWATLTLAPSREAWKNLTELSRHAIHAQSADMGGRDLPKLFLRNRLP